MKDMIRKNQLMITALAVMLAIAGYLQFSGKSQKEAPGEREKVAEVISDDLYAAPNDLSAEDLILSEEVKGEITQEELQEVDLLDIGDDLDFPDMEPIAEGEILDAIPTEGEIPGEAIFSSEVNGMVLAEAKLLKEQMRAKNKETLLEIIDNEALGTPEKQVAIDKMIQMTDFAEKEAGVEILLEAKGFDGVVVSVNENGVDLVVNALELDEVERAQIEDIVKRKTGVETSNIVISTLVP